MKSFKTLYKSAAFHFLNTLLLLVILNLLLGALYFIKDAYTLRSAARPSKLFNEDGSPVDNGKRLRDHLEWFDYNATREMSEQEAAEVLDDFYDMHMGGYIYQPWVQYQRPPFQGKRVTIEAGKSGITVRRTTTPRVDQSKPVIDIFTLGGSTTFGYYVPDEQTWPSYLTAILNERAKAEGLDVQVRVTNYGCAGYYPTMEGALALDLFRNGHRPHMLIFMDGINWGPDEDAPEFTRELERAFFDLQHENREMAAAQLKNALWKWIPMLRLAASIKYRLGRQTDSQHTGNNPAAREKPLTNEQTTQVQYVLQRFKQNRNVMKRVGEEYGAETLFFLQPDPVYNYPVELYRRALPDTWWTSMKQRQLFYEEMSKDSGFVSLSQLFETFGVGKGRKAILDDVHYSPNFNRHVAEAVASVIDLQRLKAASLTRSAVPTGTRRAAALP